MLKPSVPTKFTDSIGSREILPLFDSVPVPCSFKRLQFLQYRWNQFGYRWMDVHGT